MNSLIPLLTLALITGTGGVASAQRSTAPAPASSPASGQSAPRTGPTATPATDSGSGSNQALLTGCVQKATGLPQIGVKSPSGYVLMNASTESYAASGTSGAPRTPPGTPGVSGGIGASGRNEPGSDSPRGSTLGSGLAYLLDGQGIEVHAGEYVEVRGRLASVQDGAQSSTAPHDYPQRIVVSSMRTLSKTCPQ